MARKDALLRLHERLISKRDALRAKVTGDLDLSLQVSSGTGDVGDAANDGAQNELNSQLAALESRELNQVERAIELIRQGRYGKCEHCNHAIPITRLKALPYTPVCIDCQRSQEELGFDPADPDANWESVFENEGRMNDRELSLGDIDVDG
jgi:DnaK suppressor protein